MNNTLTFEAKLNALYTSGGRDLFLNEAKRNQSVKFYQ